MLLTGHHKHSRNVNGYILCWTFFVAKRGVWSLQWRHNGNDGVSNHSLTFTYLTVYLGADKKHERSASLALVPGIHRWPVNSPHKRPVTRKIFPFDDAIMHWISLTIIDCVTKIVYHHVNLWWWGYYVIATITGMVNFHCIHLWLSNICID